MDINSKEFKEWFGQSKVVDQGYDGAHLAIIKKIRQEYGSLFVQIK